VEICKVESNSVVMRRSWLAGWLARNEQQWSRARETAGSAEPTECACCVQRGSMPRRRSTGVVAFMKVGGWQCGLHYVPLYTPLRPTCWSHPKSQTAQISFNKIAPISSNRIIQSSNLTNSTKKHIPILVDTWKLMRLRSNPNFSSSYVAIYVA
jgi:hypothetical protein